MVEVRGRLGLFTAMGGEWRYHCNVALPQREQREQQQHGNNNKKTEKLGELGEVLGGDGTPLPHGEVQRPLALGDALGDEVTVLVLWCTWL